MGVSAIQGKLKGVLDVIAENRNEDNQSLLTVMSQLEDSLHPNHYLILGIKEIIIQRLMRSIVSSVCAYRFVDDVCFPFQYIARQASVHFHIFLRSLIKINLFGVAMTPLGQIMTRKGISR